ncbi:RidA family protein [Paracoccus sp. PAR01]|uniref:RidA family protein n=1 Tax=Paracoccus sp. PAR01 TaxID=2769282 RepID=UPI00177AA8E6|nr:RidA family protein [Paracoccus sp. PAR01]MBD9529386.1 RidA family protein [Paracoccus sp. PAR01]
MSITARLKALGHDLPAAPTPAANYAPWTRAGNLLTISGQVSRTPQGEMLSGTVGGAVSPEDGKKAAEVAALNLIAQIAAATEGEIGGIGRILRLGVFVASTPEFTGQSQVANGASDLIAAVFGEAGRHARSAVGVAALPGGASVEVEATVELVLP